MSMIFYTNKTVRHDIAEILVKVAQNTITVTVIILSLFDKYSFVYTKRSLLFIILLLSFFLDRERRGRDHMIVGFTTTCPIRAL